MSRPALTKAEIASLLRGLTDPLAGAESSQRPDGSQPALVPGRDAALSEPGGTPGNADRLGLQAAWQRTGAFLSGQFSTLFRVDAVSRPAQDQRVTQGQFLLCCPDSMCLFRLPLEGPAAPGWLTVDRALMLALLDRLLGGPLVPHQGECRLLSEFENRIAGQMVEACIRALEAAWPELRVAVVPSEAACRLNRTWLSCREPYACCELELQLGPVSGRVAIAIPWQIARQAIVHPPHGDVHAVPASVRITVVAGSCSVSARELAQLEVGDLIPTQQAYDQPLDVLVADTVRYRGRVGSCEGYKAVRIEAPCQIDRARAGLS